MTEGATGPFVEVTPKGTYVRKAWINIANVTRILTMPDGTARILFINDEDDSLDVEETPELILAKAREPGAVRP